MSTSLIPQDQRWYRQPIIWLGIVIFAATLAGCILLIIYSMRYADEPVDTSGPSFRMPMSTITAPVDPGP